MAPATITAIDAQPDIRLLRLMQLVSPALPVGAFAYSQGMEYAVQAGWVTFPSTVYAGMSFGQRLEAIILPCATLVLVVLAHMMRMTRAAILSVWPISMCPSSTGFTQPGRKVAWKHLTPGIDISWPVADRPNCNRKNIIWVRLCCGYCGNCSPIA